MIPNVLFNNGSRTKDLRVDILEGTINDHTVIQIDGAQYQKHNAKRGGSIYQCDKCCFSSDPTNEFGGSLSKYCSPTHNCWEGANINTYDKDSNDKLIQTSHGESKHPIYWTQIIVSPVDRINVVQVEI